MDRNFAYNFHQFELFSIKVSANFLPQCQSFLCLLTLFSQVASNDVGTMKFEIFVKRSRPQKVAVVVPRSGSQ